MNFLERLGFDGKLLVQPFGTAFTSTIDVQLEVPKKQEVIYRPDILETLKFAWIQYIAFLIPLWYIVDAAMSILLKYRIFEA